MARPRKHADSGAKLAAFRASHYRLDIYVSAQVGATIERLAAQFELPKAHVTEHLIRFALLNRTWSKTGFPHAE